MFNDIIGKNKVGLTSNFIGENYAKKISTENYPVNFLMKKGNFPHIELDKNVIFICTGTGIAPIRFYLWDRFEKYKRNGSVLIGKSILFFGCRNKHKDFLYSEELETFKNEKNFKYNYFIFNNILY